MSTAFYSDSWELRWGVALDARAFFRGQYQQGSYSLQDLIRILTSTIYLYQIDTMDLFYFFVKIMQFNIRI